MGKAANGLPGETEKCRPGPHNKNPRHKIFAKGWVAQKNIFDRYLDGCAKIFQDFPRVGSEKTRILDCELGIGEGVEAIRDRYFIRIFRRPPI